MRIEFSLIHSVPVTPARPTVTTVCLSRPGSVSVSPKRAHSLYPVLLCQEDVWKNRSPSPSPPSPHVLNNHMPEEFICLGLALSQRWHTSGGFLLLLKIDAANSVIKMSKTCDAVWGRASFVRRRSSCAEEITAGRVGGKINMLPG